MATWIKLYDSLPQHKKLMRFRKLLKISTAEAVGLLCLLWLWAINNAHDGDLSDVDAQDIAEVCAWKKKPDALLSALIETGFVTDDMRLHDWDDYAGTLMYQREEARRQTRERVERYRKNKKAQAEKSDTCNGDVTRYTSVTSEESNEECNGDVTQVKRDCNAHRVEKSREEKSKSNKKGDNPPLIPPQISDAFSDFAEMRKKIKAPLTDRATQLALSKLETLAPGDYDTQRKILEQSTMRSWRGLFELKDEGGAKHGQTVRVDEDDTLSAMVF